MSASASASVSASVAALNLNPDPYEKHIVICWTSCLKAGSDPFVGKRGQRNTEALQTRSLL